ncbi:hypothetical protein AWI12_18345 [Enterobacter asburiae]|nr:hypothetical protein AWI12_18345 [Enterobacter asburiae]
MYYSSDLLSAANEVQVLAFFKGDVSFFPVATTTDTLSVTFNFPFNYQGVNDFDFDKVIMTADAVKQVEEMLA